MKVMPADNIKIMNPSFRSSFRVYLPKENPEFKSYGQIIVRTSSNILREDINFRDLLKYMILHFKDVPVVNTYSLACSDLSESYSYKIAVKEEVPNELQSKFSNLWASDIDKEILDSIKSGRINIYGVEFAEAMRRYGYDLTKYFKSPGISVMVKGDDVSESDTILSYEPVKELKDGIIIKRSDILTELLNIKDEGNSVVMCRNVFPYLSYKYTDAVIEAAKKNLKNGSLFIIGNYDTSVRNINKILLKNGFFAPINKEGCQYIFERS